MKLSQYPFSQGLPGSMNSVFTPTLPSQCRTALAANSGPLSDLICSGGPCSTNRSVKHRNLFAHAPERLHDEITVDYNDMIYAETRQEIEARRKAFIRKWRLKHRAVADSLEEAVDRLFTFTRLPPSQWRSARTTNAIERLHEEFKRRIKTQTVVLTQNSKKARKHRVFGAAAIPSSAFSRFCPPSVPCSCCGYAAAPRWNSNSSPCGIS